VAGATSELGEQLAMRLAWAGASLLLLAPELVKLEALQTRLARRVVAHGGGTV